MNNATNLINEIRAGLKELALETDNVRKSEFFKAYLDTVSKFWQYSYHNQLLIHFQMPNAAKVAGFVKWKELGRNVKKGSKAIKVLAPSFRKITEADQETMLETEKEIALFFPVNVFDISQTEGNSLPEIDVTVKGDGYRNFLETLTAFCEEKKIKVNFKSLGINGLYGYSMGGAIAISDNESINTQANTIIHEIAHEILHITEESKKLSRQQKEIQAEGTAYVVTKHFGMENKSFNYLALYDANYEKIMENLKAIAEASKEIIEFVDKKLADGLAYDKPILL